MAHKHLNTGTLLIFVAAMLWATDAPFRVALLTHISATTLVLGEHLASSLILTPVLWRQRRAVANLSARDWLRLCLLGIGGSALATLAFTAAFAYVNPSVAILLQKLQPFLAIALAHAWLGERQGRRFWLWAILAIVGAYLLSFPNLVPRVYEGEVFTPNLLGAALALLAAGLWASATVCGRATLQHVSPSLTTALRLWIGSAILLLWVVASGQLSSLGELTGLDLLLIATVACVSGAGSLSLYYRGLRTTSASVATVAELGFPLTAVVVNLLVLGVWLRPGEWLGALALLTAVLALARSHGVAGVRPD
jgi:drug/metabolite transporter (DMT)-like permease